eukprot:CAMPEP_0195036890 /NCGR_PEP_ID=MMETSP0326_2-20130528/73654_1 /TAXON_ID=2866 ORGANISM="Crypthecodinium cohnii, Strain Seligo" /NCGR_SAMPLE_ID=MMETSP0326_2 /ASSEMBLY_ACC=CAM_ASM_000348 /LENGTH=134 /DNA_ID=CAMNT_0040062673 /DNA_START=295 /DNA_END=697 /DNA_ORIENTATION=+
MCGDLPIGNKSRPERLQVSPPADRSLAAGQAVLHRAIQNAVHLLLEILDVHSLQAIELLGWKLDFRDGLVVDVGACLTMPRRSASVKQLPYPGEAALIRGFQSQTCRICASQLKGFEAVFEAALHVFDSSDAVD